MNEDPSVRPIVDGKFGFDNEKVAYAGLQRMQVLAHKDKVTPPDFGAAKDSDVKGGFINKQYAMIVDANGPAAQFKGQKVNFDIYPHPTVNGNKLTVGGGWPDRRDRSQTDESDWPRWTWPRYSPPAARSR